MSTLRSTSKSSDNPKPDNGRRSFIWKTGAAMSAVVASAVAGISSPKVDQDSDWKDQVDRLSNRIGSLEDANALRTLHQTYEYRLDQGMYEEVIQMFTADAEVVYNGGLFSGQKSIRRLYCDYFGPGSTGKKMAPAPGFQPEPEQQQDVVEVSGDRKSAIGRFPYSMQVGTPMPGDSSLVHMARLQGGGILTWWESGIHEVSYVKVGHSWKIRRLEYRVTSKADYAPGRSYAKPISVPSFSEVYPANPAGPDKLIAPREG
jgi:hypothetical protein